MRLYEQSLNYKLASFPVRQSPFIPSKARKLDRSERETYQSREIVSRATATPLAVSQERSHEGHSALLQGLGEIGDVQTVLVPWLLRLSHIRYDPCMTPCAPDPI